MFFKHCTVIITFENSNGIRESSSSGRMSLGHHEMVTITSHTCTQTTHTQTLHHTQHVHKQHTHKHYITYNTHTKQYITYNTHTQTLHMEDIRTWTGFSTVNIFNGSVAKSRLNCTLVLRIVYSKFSGVRVNMHTNNPPVMGATSYMSHMVKQT